MLPAPACPFILLLAVLPGLAQTPPAAERLAPYVPSPQVVVERMLEAARLKPGETVYDLGCGDGRILIIAAQKFKAKGVGVELSADLARKTQEHVKRLGLQNRITIIHGDLLGADVSSADVVTLYLETSSNARLRPRLEQFLKSGARVVSHDFAMRGWKPVRIEKVEDSSRIHTIYVYQIKKN